MFRHETFRRREEADDAADDDDVSVGGSENAKRKHVFKKMLYSSTDMSPLSLNRSRFLSVSFIFILASDLQMWYEMRELQCGNRNMEHEKWIK